MGTMKMLGEAERFVRFVDDLEREQHNSGTVYVDWSNLAWIQKNLRSVPAQLLWNFAVFSYEQLTPSAKDKMPPDLFQIMQEESKRMRSQVAHLKQAGIVTWLHLSDLHCKGKGDYDRGTVLDPLWEDIERRCQRISQDLKDLDFVFLTGDLAYHGTQEEYRFLGEKVLPRLLDATGLAKTRLFVVPGNHDICRDKITDAAQAGREQLLKELETSTPITKALQRASERLVYFPRLEAYCDFFQQTFGQTIELDEEGYFYEQSIFLPSGATMAILGLNSAWLSYGGESDRGKLALGEYQVDKAIRKAREAHPDLLIALNHHPFEWLADNFDRQQVELLLRRNCHFVLQGHRHRTKVFQEETLEGKTLFILAGAGYEDRYSSFSNGYNFVRLNLDNGEGKIYFRRYSHQQRRWLPDSDATGTDDGIEPFTLDRLLSSELARY